MEIVSGRAASRGNLRESLLQMVGSMEKPAAAENVQGPANEMHDLAGSEPREKQEVGGIVFPTTPVGVVKPSAQTTRPLNGYPQQHWEIPLKDYVNAVYSSTHWGMRNPQLTSSSTWDSGEALQFMVVADASQQPRGKWETQTMPALSGEAGWPQRSLAACGKGKEEIVQGWPFWSLAPMKWEQKVLGLLGKISVDSLIPELGLPYFLKMEAKQGGDKYTNLLGVGYMNENETLQLEGLEQIYFTWTSRGKEMMIFQAPVQQDSYGSQLGLEGGAQFDPMRRDCLLEELSFRKAISLWRKMNNPECGKSSGLLTNLAARRKKETYVCSVCGKSFSYKGNLIKHERIHTGEKLCTCSECGKTFCDRSYFLVHQRKHASEKGHHGQ